jgi:hypothetical protein
MAFKDCIMLLQVVYDVPVAGAGIIVAVACTSGAYGFSRLTIALK